MNAIKSITTINTTAGWAARQRNQDGTELFIVCAPETGQRYTMHQAQMAAENLRSHLARGGVLLPRPAGVFRQFVPRSARKTAWVVRIKPNVPLIARLAGCFVGGCVHFVAPCLITRTPAGSASA